MKRILQSGVVLFAGILGMASASGQPDQNITKNRKKIDLREAILRKFLRNNHSTVEEYAGIFLAEADTHCLDWRLLPSISIVESGGGRTARGNNLFGWANGRVAFTSIGDAIHQVASTLSHGKYYKNKDLNGKLLAYNPNVEYGPMVLAIMRQISPTPQLRMTE